MTYDILDWDGPHFLALYFALAIASLLCVHFYGLMVRREARGVPVDRRLTAAELGYLCDGPARAADVIALSFLRAGALKVAGAKLQATDRPEGRGLPSANLARFDEGPLGRRQLAKAWEPQIETIHARLLQARLVLSSAQIAELWVATVLLLAPCITLGVTKAIIGAGRGKPVGFLLFLMAVTIICGLRMTKGSILTEAGRKALADVRQSNERALRAPLENEILVAFAVGGTRALVGTDLAPYILLVHGQQSDGRSGYGSCGSGCGGGGGGGCGGCGGGD